MTFTYDTENPTDITRVRYHTSDTVEDTATWSDEDITFAISLNNGNWQQAVISLLEQYAVNLTLTPDFRADWLSIDSGNPLDGLRELISVKRREFRLASITATAKHVYRADSLAKRAPDYDDPLA